MILIKNKKTKHRYFKKIQIILKKITKNVNNKYIILY